MKGNEPNNEALVVQTFRLAKHPDWLDVYRVTQTIMRLTPGLLQIHINFRTLHFKDKFQNQVS